MTGRCRGQPLVINLSNVGGGGLRSHTSLVFSPVWPQPFCNNFTPWLQLSATSSNKAPETHSGVKRCHGGVGGGGRLCLVSGIINGLLLRLFPPQMCSHLMCLHTCSPRWCHHLLIRRRERSHAQPSITGGSAFWVGGGRGEECHQPPKDTYPGDPQTQFRLTDNLPHQG